MYFEGLVSSAFRSLHIQHIGDLPSLSDLGRLSLESTRPETTSSGGEWSQLGISIALCIGLSVYVLDIGLVTESLFPVNDLPPTVVLPNLEDIHIS